MIRIIALSLLNHPLNPCDTQATLKQEEFGLILAYSRFSRNSQSPRHKLSGIPGNSLGLPPRYLRTVIPYLNQNEGEFIL
jgi:hypothetical protein